MGNTSFEGKVAVVTGGNSGLGKATALKFAASGAKVVIAARRIPEGEETVRLIRSAGGEALFVQTDVSKAEQVETMVRRTVEIYGRLDCAFNNAGVGRGAGRVHEVQEEDWDTVMDVNLKGTWLCMKYEVQQMLKQAGGAIVNDSSMAGLVGYSLGTAYSASKHGIVGLTKSAALQYAADGIRINAICPGIIPTPNIQSIFNRVPALEEWALAASPLGRLGTAEEIAQTVVWLCSEEASYVTGLAMLVDGGINAGLKPS